jgi:hypothetical protein
MGWYRPAGSARALSSFDHARDPCPLGSVNQGVANVADYDPSVTLKFRPLGNFL